MGKLILIMFLCLFSINTANSQIMLGNTTEELIDELIDNKMEYDTLYNENDMLVIGTKSSDDQIIKGWSITNNRVRKHVLLMKDVTLYNKFITAYDNVLGPNNNSYFWNTGNTLIVAKKEKDYYSIIYIKND